MVIATLGRDQGVRLLGYNDNFLVISVILNFGCFCCWGKITDVPAVEGAIIVLP